MPPFIDIRFSPQGASTRYEFEYGIILESEDQESFRILGHIGGGFNGAVFSAEQLGPDDTKIRDCAIKMLKQLDQQRFDRFQNEVRIIRLLDHESIAGSYGSGSVIFGPKATSIPWLAMDRGGNNLRDEISRNGPLELSRFKTVALQICNAVQHIHTRGILHRDIKPANFVWSFHYNGDRDRIMMIDFGIAKLFGEDMTGRQLDEFTRENDFVGPQSYMSPELIEYARNKKHPVDYRSDYFQLGLLLWYLATNTIVAGIPAARLDPFGGTLHSVVIELLQQSPQDRPQSLDEIKSTLLSL